MRTPVDLEPRHRGWIAFACVALIPVITWADLRVGSLVQLSTLYYVPVAGLAWVWGRWAGVGVAAAATTLLGATLISWARTPQEVSAALVNTGLRGVAFAVVALLVARIQADRVSRNTQIEAATEALRASEERWRFAIEGNGDGLWDWHIPSGKVFYSRTWKSALGFEESEIGDNVDEFLSRIHPADKERAEAATRDFMAGRTLFFSIELRVRCKDGSWKWIHDRGATIERDDQGRPVRQIGTHTDISARKRLEHQLSLFKAVIDATSEAVVITDATGHRVTFVNRAHERLWGRTLDQAREKSPRDYFSSASADVVETRVLPALARGESYEIEADAVDATGRAFPLWFRADVVPGLEGDEPSIVAIMHDRTEAKKAEAALRLSEERYRTVVNSLFEGIVVQDAEGRVESANPAAERILGLSFDQLRGRTSTDPAWQTFHEDGSPFPGETHPIVVARLTGESQRDVVMGLRTPGNDLKWLMVNAQPTPYTEEGRTTGAVASIVDITRLRSTEESLRSLLKDKQALLMEVHHRVKNNLQVIASLLRLEANRADEPGTRGVLKDMQTRIAAMALLHETVYRSQSFAELNLSDYLRQLASQFFRAQVRGDAIRLAFDLDDEAHKVIIDQAVTCGLLVSELLTNAIKHAFPEGRSGEVRVGLRGALGGGVALTVSDDGVGLPEDLVHRQAESLGLLLVTDLARQLGGSLKMASEKGASFTVTFSPKSAPAPPSARA